MANDSDILNKPVPNAPIGVNQLVQGVNWFEVSIPATSGDTSGGAGTSPDALKYLFRAVRGLGRSIEVEVDHEGGVDYGARSKPKGSPTYGQVTLEHGLVAHSGYVSGLRNRVVGNPPTPVDGAEGAAGALWKWCLEVKSVEKAKFRRDVTIRHLAPAIDGKSAKEVQKYRLLRAFPVKWAVSDLDANGTTIAVVTITLVYECLLLADEPIPEEPFRATLETTEGERMFIEFPMNPNRISSDRSLDWKGNSQFNSSQPVMAVPTSAIDYLSIQGVILDSEEASPSVGTILDTLHKMTLAQKFPNEVRQRPPRVLFQWKNTRFIGGIAELRRDIVRRSPDGDRSRAVVDLRLEGQLLARGMAAGDNLQTDRRKLKDSTAQATPASGQFPGED